MAVKYGIDDKTLTGIADPLRSLAGREEKLTPAEMAAAGHAANAEVNTQTDLIAQIQTALEEKTAPGTGKPEQEKTVLPINMNGTHTITPDEGYTLSRVTVLVNVPDVPAVVDVLEVTENGAYNAADDGLEGYSVVTVNVPDTPAVVEELNVTENGEYTPGDGVDGFSRVTVNVPAGTTEIWTFTMEDGSEVTKDVVVT